MRTAQFTRVSCDVLCIGGSGAAVSAAFMAARKGMSVALVSKGKAGRSGNAMMVGGGFGVDGYSARHILGEAQADERYTPQALFEKVVKASFFLSDQALAEQFVTEAPLMTKQFLEWSRAAGQNFPFVKSGLYAVSGSSVGKTIQQGIKSAVGCKVYDDVMVLELLTDCGRVAGALGLDIYTGDYIVFEAKCVVLATGGFQPHTLKNTISEMSGDGMAMALRAGARLADMEFLLYIPTAVQPPYLRGSILPYLFTIPVFMPLSFKVIDRTGKTLEIPAPFDDVAGSNKLKKLIYSYFWSTGSTCDTMNGNLFFDYSMHTDEQINQAFDFFTEHYSRWHKKGYYNGVDLAGVRELLLRERRLEFALGNEYSNGGVVINERMQTDLEGLFAAGETTSGLFGALRAGDGLTEMLAHGYRAGLEAAAFAAGAARPGNLSAQAEKIVAELESVFERPVEEMRVPILAARLRSLADSGLNVVRDEQKIRCALDGVREIRRELGQVGIASKSRRYNLDYLGWLELRNLSVLTEAALLAAGQRRESRGSHIRADYPGVDNHNYLCRLTAKLENGRLAQGRIRPRAGRLPLPDRDYNSVADCLADIL